MRRFKRYSTLISLEPNSLGANPHYIGGEGDGSSEDCGGIPGLLRLEAISDPTHEGHAEAKEWADEYDPDAVDELPIKYALSRIGNGRNAAKVRVAKERWWRIAVASDDQALSGGALAWVRRSMRV